MKTWSKLKNPLGGSLVVAFSLCFAGTAMADLEILKTYKATFEGEKPKCTCCHTDKTPKKEEGKHENNDYGKKLLAAKKELQKEKVDEDVLKKVGKNEAAEE